MRTVVHAVLVALALTCAACSGDDDDDTKTSQHPDDAGKDAGEKADAASQHPGSKPPGFGMYHGGGILELDDAGRPIVRDGSVTPDTSDGGGFGGNGGGSNGSGGSEASLDGGAPTPAQLDVPADPAAHGPWVAGVRTLQVDLGSGRSMTAEVWYPAQAKSADGKKTETYDLAEWLPPQAHDQLKPNELPVNIPCDCYRDLPIDEEHGPYPVSIVVHNVAGSRIEALTVAAHWASRGFIVVAADHPQLTLGDSWAALSGGRCTGKNVTEDSQRMRDVPAELRALQDAPGDWAFLAGLANVANFAVSGQVVGAEFAAAMNGTPGMKLMMLWSSSISGKPAGDVKSVVYLAGQEASWNTDSYTRIKAAFNTTANYGIGATTLVGIDRATAQQFTPYCSAKTPDGVDGDHINAKYGFCGLDFSDGITNSDCKSTYLTQVEADAIFKFVTTAALEETLMGKDADKVWSGFDSGWGERLTR